MKIIMYRYSRVMFVIILLSFFYLVSVFCYTAWRNYVNELETEEILHQQRSNIEQEMENYPYNMLVSRNNTTSKLSDLVMEKGGRPMRSVIVTNWRSGSSFLGDLISAHPSSFYTYEPLLYFGVKKIRSPSASREALGTLESLFHCNFTKLDGYIEYRKIDPWLTYQYNRYLKELCKDVQLCVNKEFSSKLCQLFPFQVLKIVNLKLEFIETFLKAKSLGLKILYLIRDPRAIINSRKNLDWCENSPDCFNKTIFCSNLVEDYYAAYKFENLYPETFRVLRYEDLATNPDKYSKIIYDFYGLYFHESVHNFVRTHTAFSIGDEFSTFRNSNATAFQWRNKLTFDEVKTIQRHCYKAIKLWNYQLVFDHSQLLYGELLMEKGTGDINYL